MGFSLKLTTLNVEGHKHVARIVAFLEQEKPQLLCLQEVFKVDLPRFAACLDSQTYIHFVPTLIVDRPNDFGFDPLGEYGVVMISSFPLQNLGSAHYFGEAHQVPLINDRDSNTPNRFLLWADVMTDAGALRVITTHFTWSPNGEACEPQRYSMQNLLKIFDTQIKTGLLCGDLNIPKGGEMYQVLADRFTDNLPENLTTTLDSEFHRIPGLELVVDYVFTTPEYVISNVRFHKGVSDHQALSAELSLL